MNHKGAMPLPAAHKGEHQKLNLFVYIAPLRFNSFYLRVLYILRVFAVQIFIFRRAAFFL
jgi:hypothetical protein